VQPSNDNEGDLIIRGNASTGVLWRLEGVDILNPNHFARLGGSGGGLSIFSVSVLGTSDFFSGAFPAEYGNALAGVFDMRFRNGDRERRRYRLRAGLLGLEAATEGPLRGRKSKGDQNGKQPGSYLVNYRYSTLGVLNEMGIYLVGDRVRNNFQDLSFNLFFPGKSERSTLRLWGTGGLSVEEKVVAERPWRTFDDSLRYETGSDMGVLGLTHTYSTTENSHLRTTVAVMGQQAFYQQWRNSTTGSQQLLQDENYIQGKLALSTFFTQKISPKSVFKTGLQLSALRYDMQYDSIQANGRLLDYISEKGTTALVQPFAQFSFRPDGKWTLNVGLHSLYFALTESVSLEPRISIRRQMGARQSLSLSLSQHAQIVPLGVYFINRHAGAEVEQPNRNLPLMKSLHAVLWPTTSRFPHNCDCMRKLTGKG